MVEALIVAILVALLLSSVIYFLADLIVRKVAMSLGMARIVWIVAVVLIILVWWVRVLAPALGPLP